MKINTTNRLLLPLFALILMTGCDKIEHESLSLYSDYREVPVYGTVLIGPKTGSGNYTLEIENPYLLSAEVQTGWSSPSGMIAIHGILTGKTSIIVTDNVTKESKKVQVKVTNNYEVLRISKYEDDPLPPSLSNVEFLYLVNNKAKDLYLVSRENISLTDYVLKVRGKGKYKINTEGGDYNLTLSYIVDKNEQPTIDETSAITVSNSYLITMGSYALHRLNQNLNLSFETSLPENAENVARINGAAPIEMKNIHTEYKLQGELWPFMEMPVGHL